MYTTALFLTSLTQLSFDILMVDTLQLFLKLSLRPELEFYAGISCSCKAEMVEYDLIMIWAFFKLNLVENVLSLAVIMGLTTINLDSSDFISALFETSCSIWHCWFEFGVFLNSFSFDSHYHMVELIYLHVTKMYLVDFVMETAQYMCGDIANMFFYLFHIYYV